MRSPTLIFTPPGLPRPPGSDLLAPAVPDCILAPSKRESDSAVIKIPPLLPTALASKLLNMLLLTRDTALNACTNTLPLSPCPEVLVFKLAPLPNESDPVVILILPPFPIA